MKIESVRNLEIAGIKLIEFGKFLDHRGWFCEPYRENQLAELIPGFRCVQVNQSCSQPNVVRGLHIQTDPAMGKLVRVIEGKMNDLCLDVRKGSPTFGSAISIHMTPGVWIWVPPGIAHGNYFFSRTTIEYLCTAEYNQAGESGISPWAPDIQWDAWGPPPHRGHGAIVSDKDAAAQTLAQWKEAHQ